MEKKKLLLKLKLPERRRKNKILSLKYQGGQMNASMASCMHQNKKIYKKFKIYYSYLRTP